MKTGDHVIVKATNACPAYRARIIGEDEYGKIVIMPEFSPASHIHVDPDAIVPERYTVAPARGFLNRPKKDRWSVVETRTMTVMHGPFTSEAQAQMIADAMNANDESAKVRP